MVVWTQNGTITTRTGVSTLKLSQLLHLRTINQDALEKLPPNLRADWGSCCADGETRLMRQPKYNVQTFANK